MTEAEMDADELERSKWSEEKRKAWEKKWEEHAHEVWMGDPFTGPCAKCLWRYKNRSKIGARKLQIA